eukprot:CAMPEP_0194370940 /NCGR_PEP_ID=MMETSP0174-20130528/19281_1 /TAXON_ID=216777 /ORGANISM="Proboscia alata, Strain PI-D3" /LENGTH=373 /DNA_ID=CAMNT_0039148687 /DNA_START=186 /DNA_END=1307 /DNA_ORIENTATION=+
MTLLVHAQEEVMPKVGDNICVQGFIMDTYCIELGNLLDNPKVVTLSPNGPTDHSVHCLLDVRQCYTSRFEVLNLLTDNSGWYGRAWSISTNQPILDYGRSVGRCDTCEKGVENAIPRGLRLTMTATVLDLGDADTPPLIQLVDNGIAPFEEFETICGNSTRYIPPNGIIATGAGALTQTIIIHGSIMLVGWGLLLPTGAIVARFGKHRPNAWWFKLHRVIQPLGLTFALIGWIIALLNFTTLEGSFDGRLNYPHALLGMTTMCIGLIQPLNAIVRPHGPEEGKPKSTLRFVWEITHKGLGWLGIGLGICTVGIGTTLLQDKVHRKVFQIVYGACVGSFLCFLVIFLSVESRGLTNSPRQKSMTVPSPLAGDSP